MSDGLTRPSLIIRRTSDNRTMYRLHCTVWITRVGAVWSQYHMIATDEREMAD